MILPTKFLPAERSLISVGGEILSVLRDGPRSVSELWERFRSDRKRKYPLNYDWFVLALTLLYAVDSVELVNGLVRLVKAAGHDI